MFSTSSLGSTTLLVSLKAFVYVDGQLGKRENQDVIRIPSLRKNWNVFKWGGFGNFGLRALVSPFMAGWVGF